MIGEAAYLQVQKRFSRSVSTIVNQENSRKTKINSEKSNNEFFRVDFSDLD